MSEKTFSAKLKNNCLNLFLFFPIFLNLFFSSYFITNWIVIFSLSAICIFFCLFCSIQKIINKFCENKSNYLDNFLFFNRFFPLKNIQDLTLLILGVFYLGEILKLKAKIVYFSFLFVASAFFLVSIFSVGYELFKFLSLEKTNKFWSEERYKKFSVFLNEIASVLKNSSYILVLISKTIFKKNNPYYFVVILFLYFFCHLLKIMKDLFHRRFKIMGRNVKRVTKNDIVKFFTKELLFNLTFFLSKLTLLSFILNEAVFKKFNYIFLPIFSFCISVTTFLLGLRLLIIFYDKKEKVRIEKVNKIRNSSIIEKLKIAHTKL